MRLFLVFQVLSASLLAWAAAPLSAQSGYGSYAGNEAAGYPYGYGQGTAPAAGTYGSPYGYPYRPQAGNYQHSINRPEQGAASNPQRVAGWFKLYDQIRREAQMTPSERQQADHLLSRGMAILVPGEEKIAARTLLTRLVQRYERATQAIKQLPLIPETQDLHRGYYQYFNNARLLFSDYLKVQDNLFVTDASTGKPVAGQLLYRKQLLEQLNQRVQSQDQELRARYGIPAYRYQGAG